MSLAVCDSLADLRGQVARWRASGCTVALVPTMGALHAGHMALVDAARRWADQVVVSVFVNPTQFAPTEDLAAYPRDLDGDRRRAAEAGADLVYAPDVAAMYPGGFSTAVTPAGPALAGLEDRFRPTHFAGVATVVAKLFGQVRPDSAFFGEKDYQQLRVIERVTRDLDIPVAIHGVPTVREPDGLALSSRNVYLSREERRRAPVLAQVLLRCAAALAAGETAGAASADAFAHLSGEGFAVDYIEARQADTLAPPSPDEVQPLRVLAAARLGRTRLIDNVPVAEG